MNTGRFWVGNSILTGPVIFWYFYGQEHASIEKGFLDAV